MSKNEKGFDRREFLKGTAAVAGATAVGTLAPFGAALAQTGKIKVGLMLPYTGTYAQLGVAITNGFKLAVAERGGKLSGREVEYFVVDDESNPAKGPENANKLVQRDKVDVVIGTVHSGVAMGMAKVIRESGTLWINPNAGADEVTGPLCAPNIFRTSFSNWQTTHALGKVLKARGHKNAVFITWKYAAGEQMMAGFKEGFEKEGGKLIKELYTPFPQVEFQALLTEIASIKPDAVVAFFARDAQGEGAVQTKVLPVVTGLVMAYLFVIIFRDFGALTGAQGALGWMLPALVPVFGGVGYALASALAGRDPARFRDLGKTKA